MNTISVLIARQDLLRNIKDISSPELIRAFTTYLLRPYQQLKYFSFCDYQHVDLPIDGKTDSQKFAKKIQQIYENQQGLLCKKSNDKSSTSNHKSIQTCIVTSDHFSTDTLFYNSIVNSSFMTQETKNNILDDPELYVISDVNVYK